MYLRKSLSGHFTGLHAHNMRRNGGDSSTMDERGDKTLSMRILPTSRKQYQSIVRRLSAWLEQHKPGSVLNGKILLPLSTTACKNFLSFSSLKRDKSGNAIVPEQQNSYSTINAIRSAIVYLYKESKCKMKEDLQEVLKGMALNLFSVLMQ